MFYYVQLWRNFTDPFPSFAQRVQAPSEGHAIVQVMRHHNLHTVDRAWVHHNAHLHPSLRVQYIVVKGKTRSWRQEQDPTLTAWIMLSCWLRDVAVVIQKRERSRKRRQKQQKASLSQ